MRSRPGRSPGPLFGLRRPWRGRFRAPRAFFCANTDIDSQLPARYDVRLIDIGSQQRGFVHACHHEKSRLECLATFACLSFSFNINLWFLIVDMLPVSVSSCTSLSLFP